MSDCIICCDWNYLIPTPCGHLLCVSCMEKIMREETHLCPFCRKDLFDFQTILGKADDDNTLFFLGFVYRKGHPLVRVTDESEAFRLIRKSAKKGNQYAQNYLGMIYYWGYGVSRNAKKSLKYIRLSAEQGNSLAQYNMVWFYFYPKDNLISFEEMIQWYETCKNYPPAMTFTALMYYYGYGVEQDKQKAKRLLKKIIETDYSGRYHLALIYEEEQDYKSAFELFKDMDVHVSTHYEEANGKLGYYYHFGIACEKDEKEAMRHYSEDRDNPVTQYHIGVLFEEKDPRIAKKWYRKSAKMGYEPAIYNLALMEKEKKAIELYQLLPNDSDAQCNLANIYLKKGRIAEAIELYKKSAKQKNIYAYHNLALLYETGIGDIKKSCRKALKYYKLFNASKI